MPLILIAEDEPAIADTVLYALRSEGLQAEHCLQGDGIQHLIRRAQYMWTSALQQEQSVAVARRQVEVMENHQHRSAAAGKIAHCLQDGVLMQGVEH